MINTFGLPLPVAAILLLNSALCLAEDEDLSVSLDVDSRPLAMEFLPESRDALREARVRTGLDLSVGRRLLQLDVDYGLRGKVVDEYRNGELTQRFRTRMTSHWLDSALGMDADLDTELVIREDAEAYRYRLRPVLAGRLPEFAGVRLQYEYLLDKPSRSATERAVRTYSVEMDCGFQEGSLTWKGRLISRAQFDHLSARTLDAEAVELTSSYQLARTLRVELGGALRNETDFSSDNPQTATEKRYGAILAWSPSSSHAFECRVDKLEDSMQPGTSVLRSGSISWFPRPDLELKLDYGDTLMDGATGWMLHTKFDLSG
jgi:hypothetical protein